MAIGITNSSEKSGFITPDLAVRQSDFKKVAPRDELRGHLMCVPLTGFEPVTCNIVSVPLYPLSYSGTQK